MIKKTPENLNLELRTQEVQELLEQKQSQRSELDKMMQAYLAKGGKIEVCKGRFFADEEIRAVGNPVGGR